jgi:hypothetical protein|tara:strand:+ start:90 stop:230 length:141 start_codon:yes stop_codon:yes gene_type:complete
MPKGKRKKQFSNYSTYKLVDGTKFRARNLEDAKIYADKVESKLVDV